MQWLGNACQLGARNFEGERCPAVKKRALTSFALLQSYTTTPHCFATETSWRPLLLQVYSSVELRKCQVCFHVGRQVPLPGTQGPAGPGGGGGGPGPGPGPSGRKVGQPYDVLRVAHERHRVRQSASVAVQAASLPNQTQLSPEASLVRQQRSFGGPFQPALTDGSPPVFMYHALPLVGTQNGCCCGGCCDSALAAALSSVSVAAPHAAANSDAIGRRAAHAEAELPPRLPAAGKNCVRHSRRRCQFSREINRIKTHTHRTILLISHLAVSQIVRSMCPGCSRASAGAAGAAALGKWHRREGRPTYCALYFQ